MKDHYLELNAKGIVINIIIWDGTEPYNPDGNTLMSCEEHPTVSFGWTFDGNNWIAPPEPEYDIVDLPSSPLENNNGN